MEANAPDDFRLLKRRAPTVFVSGDVPTRRDKGVQVKIEKTVVDMAIQSLTARAEECFERAQHQHRIADTQHANAEKLVVLGEKLEADAINLAGELEMAAACAAPVMRTEAVSRPATALVLFAKKVA